MEHVGAAVPVAGQDASVSLEPWRARLGRAAGQGFAAIASPKTVRAESDGSLAVESFDWSELHSGPSRAITCAEDGAGACGQWKWHDGKLVGHSPFGTGNWLTHAAYEDVELRAGLHLDAPRGACEFGFLIRADETGDQAVYARCIPGRCQVELVKQIYNRKNGPESLWRGRTVLQTFHFTPSADGRYALRLIAFGPNIEFNVNGRLAISELTLPRRRVGSACSLRTAAPCSRTFRSLRSASRARTGIGECSSLSVM